MCLGEDDLKKKVIAIVGPTAVGKTRLSIEIAKKYNGEIISGDSMQVYKEMDIGTAKVSEAEMQGIPHHMIDIKNPDESFSVVEFQKLVQHHIDDIVARNKTPILVGGSGLYVQAILYNYNFSEQKSDAGIVKRLEKQRDEQGITPLYNRLKEIDPKQANIIHPNNHRRVIRALEIYELTGKPMSEYQIEQKQDMVYDAFLIGLEMEREQLYRRINKRVDMMLEAGLEDEVKKLYKAGFEKCQSMQAIGYKEFIPYFEGKQPLTDSVELLKRNSRRYAKRQYTWFKNKMNISWYSISETEDNSTYQTIFNDLAGFLSKK